MRRKVKQKETTQQSKSITLTQFESDHITELANQYWSSDNPTKFDANVVEKVYKTEISTGESRRVVMLEFNRYLENFLWPNFKEDSSDGHLMSIIFLLNEKFRERIEVWKIFDVNSEMFPIFFNRVLVKCLEEIDIQNATRNIIREQTGLLVFLNNCFRSMEIEICREQVKKLVSLSMWTCLQPKRREQELNSIPEWKKYWKKLQKRDKPELKEKLEWERHFLQNLIKKFLKIIERIPEEGELNNEVVRYCERFLEFVIDLEALLPTRRFFNTVMDDCHLVVRCQISPLMNRPEGKLFAQLLDMLKFYARFEINDVTGDCLSDHEMAQLHYKKITSLQKAAFAKFPGLRGFALSNVASVDSRDALEQHFGGLDATALKEIASYLNLVPDELKEPFDFHRLDEEFLKNLLISRHERRISQLEALNEMPLYPTEEIVWDENIVPNEYFSGDGCLALPKLNLQFLTLHDYLYRNFNLFRLESTYEIRQDIEDAVIRMLPWQSEENEVVFGGWARMALPIQEFAVIEVGKPRIGERRPSRVRADVSISLNVRREIQEEWENLRRHDVCFLITVHPSVPIGTKYNHRGNFIEQVGLVNVRGCEIEGLLDENGRVIEEGIDEPKAKLPGDKRTYRVWLDTNQYRADMESLQEGGDDVYESFNIFLRRKPKENNFKAVLETIRHLMNTECVVPNWLHDILLGYGDPSSAHYSKMPQQARSLDFNDTFLDYQHVVEAFPDYEVKLKCNNPDLVKRPFRITFEDVPIQVDSDDEEEKPEQKLQKIINVEPYTIPKRGPYDFNEPRKNTIRFTPTQTEAIRSGMQPGMTLVVGPPGTGKTDIAVQIISNIYHNHPNQRTLIVTHSNQALNQLFEKIMQLDIDERHLLRLGHGEEALETEKDFSRYGRVNYVLSQRIELLAKVKKLQDSLNVTGDVSYTCETAGYFYLYEIIARWEKFINELEASANQQEPTAEYFTNEFPFVKFFNDAPQPLFNGKTFEENLEIAQSCYRYINHIFTELEEFRAFELLRNGLDRSKYLLVKEAKIIAMTCTHAALKRKELVDLGFKYDNILMEESAQILEIETFIPLLLQNPLDGYNRLKRWIMIGDHHQLPPVIKNMAFQKYSNMEQSLFTRLVRLGVPVVQLDGQGRARSSICELYKWRYNKLDDLPHIKSSPEYLSVNPGFVHDYQLINVENFNGVGESEPNPFFYQNLGEAEFVVATYMYMRLIGYPAEKISILTTYNGQKHLLRDVVNRRCADNPLIGLPHKVTTVDKYQGQQNDYVLISLVRTKTVGHLRDVRRLVVAASRARLGLYIFGRVSLFKNCFELRPTFKHLMNRPQKLMLVEGENYPAKRQTGDKIDGNILTINDMTEMAQYVYKMYMSKMEEMRGEYEKMKEIYEQIPQEQEQKNEKSTTKDDNKKTKENVPFVPIPIQNELDDEVLHYAGELQGPVEKRQKVEDEEGTENVDSSDNQTEQAMEELTINGGNSQTETKAEEKPAVNEENMETNENVGEKEQSETNAVTE
ncbi:RNA helicase aquarius [Chironomus tepperi]|uniref:RNA helicase aquarius n=1 Tax=Chironomus tepperi TaxID=113505 RepID=UPI00391FAC1E